MVDDIDKRIIDDLMAEEESLRFDDWLKEYKAKYPKRDAKTPRGRSYKERY